MENPNAIKEMKEVNVHQFWSLQLIYTDYENQTFKCNGLIIQISLINNFTDAIDAYFMIQLRKQKTKKKIEMKITNEIFIKSIFGS